MTSLKDDARSARDGFEAQGERSRDIQGVREDRPIGVRDRCLVHRRVHLAWIERNDSEARVFRRKGSCEVIGCGLRRAVKAP